MPTLTVQAPAKTPRAADSEGTSHGWNVVLLNCDCHTFDDVEKQLMKAVRCSLSRARELSWEVHSKGQAVVYSGPRERCEAVAAILEDIRLRVKVSQ
ncbi:MAG TPA: ATP-dependent Clp protease adaptor ClpS [Elusimicrobiota bacterium]|jgi:ATP-dependent Clp protease adapter protein ClpS|nr:ATP-dependent Clp protease adaptor ClpS [Elusimicrobiota bacterium]